MSAKPYISLILGALLALSYLSGLVSIRQEIQKYGWIYERVVYVGNEAAVETIDLREKLISAHIVLIIAATLISSGSELWLYDLDISDLPKSDSVSFVGKAPEKWALLYDPNENLYTVILGPYTVMFPGESPSSISQGDA